jgi:putative peptidoglycan lipid II flippase
MPTYSTQVARGELGEMRSSLTATLRGVILLSLPATIGLILLRKPIVALLFQRGQFTALSTEMVCWALLWYTAGLVGHSFVEILSRAFYAQHDTKTPVIVGTIAMGLNVVFSFIFVWLFQQIGWMPHGGLALANSLATTLEATALFIFMRRRLKGIEGSNIARGFGACALASLGMGIGVWLWIQATGNLASWVVALGGVLIGGVIYSVGILLQRVPEIQTVIDFAVRRLRGGTKGIAPRKDTV